MNTDVAGRDVSDCIVVDGRYLSAQEVSDFCSVLSLAERVHVLGRGGSHPATNLLAAQLVALGYPVHGDGRLRMVEPTDTVVTICGPGPYDGQFMPDPLLRPVTKSGAVLLAIAEDSCSALLTLADAAITIPLPEPRRGSHDTHQDCVDFALLVSLTVDVVGRELARRITRQERHSDHGPPAARSVDGASTARRQIPRLGR